MLLDQEDQEEEEQKATDSGQVARITLVRRKANRVVWLTVKWKGKDPKTKKPWRDEEMRLPDLWHQNIQAALIAYDAACRDASDRIAARDYTPIL
jgi:hypothetical protein